MATNEHIEGYENFANLMKTFGTKNSQAIVYFSGSKLPNGDSWCSDCVRAWPVIQNSLSKLGDDTHFIYCEVGTREEWKDSKCPFRTDPKVRLMQLPTLMRWGSPQRLDGEQCENPDLLDLLFLNED